MMAMGYFLFSWKRRRSSRSAITSSALTSSVSWQLRCAETSAKAGIRKPRESQFSKDDLRGRSLKILAVMANLSRAERERVLKHALKVNRV
jgi:hypothetical protein